MDYSDTGNFSKEQKALCRKIKELINAAKKKDLIFKVNKNKLCAYLLEEIDLAAECDELKDFNHPIKSLNCGIINQNIGENEYYWEIEIFIPQDECSKPFNTPKILGCIDNIE